MGILCLLKHKIPYSQIPNDKQTVEIVESIFRISLKGNGPKPRSSRNDQPVPTPIIGLLPSFLVTLAVIQPRGTNPNPRAVANA